MKAASTRALSVFYSYAHEDLALRDALDKHLATLRRSGWIQSWSDRDIRAGTEWKQEIDTHLRTADIILLLVSSDFLSSEYCYSIEVQEALRRHEAGKAVVIPIILRPVDWHGTPFSSLQVLPAEGRPVTSWSNHDEAFEQIAQGIRGVVTALRQLVFIASSPLDQSFVERLSQGLAARGVVLWDRGQVQLQEALGQEEVTHSAIRTASAVLLIASPNAPYSHVLQEHLKLATLLNKPMIVVWATGDDWDKSVSKGWREKDAVDARGERYETALMELVARLRSRISLSPFVIPSSGTQEILFEPRNPYKGLRAFSRDDARDFFGRATLIGELIDVLEASLVREKRESQDSRLLTVIGPSGSGKSSVVMAGLLPCLQSGGVLHGDEWAYLDRVLPGGHPLEALAVTLARELPERSVLSLQQDLQSDSVRVLHLLASQIAQRPETKVVLLVDQFEELFTLTISEEERQHFIDLLVTAVTEPRGPVIVILTLRADFYDRPMSYPLLSRIMREHLVQVLPMEIGDLRAVIEQPALLPEVGLTFEGDLVSDLLFEMRGQVGALPLLEFTLEQLFQRRNGRLLTLQAYREIGGVKGALSKHAEATYATLPSEEHRKLARALFLRLIDPGLAKQDTAHRRAALTELSLPDPSQTKKLREVADAFIAARLLTTNEIAGTTTIEVSHEALIREWTRLADWLREAREDIRLQQTISEDSAEWELHNKPGDRLYRGSRLKEAQAWAKRNPTSKQEHAFLQASAARQVRAFIALGAVMLLVVTLSGIAGWSFLNRPPTPNYVTTTDGSATGSLRWAIGTAHEGNTITFDPSLAGQTIVLQNADVHIIQKNLVIEGLTTGHITIREIGASLVVDEPASVTISGVAFQGSSIKNQLPLIQNAGKLWLKNCTVSGNTATGGGEVGGGGIANSGTLNMSKSSISGNTVNGGGVGGGGVANSGTLNMSNSNVSGNTYINGYKGSEGGGIANSGTLNMSNSNVSGNTVTGGNGGGIANSGTLNMSNSNVSGNKSINGDDGFGGGIYSAGSTLNMSNSTVSGNTATNGGGIANFSGSTLNMSNSTVSGNTATNGGGIANCYYNFNGGSTLNMSNSTVSGNTATNGGGIANFGGISGNTLNMSNSTVSGNTATNGGGIFNASVIQVDLTFSTIYGNTAHDAGDIAIEDSAISSNGQDKPIKQISQVKIRNSIVASNPAHPGPDISGTLISSGYNLFQGNSGATFDPATRTQHGFDKTLSVNDLTRLFADPVRLQDNGGPTKTLALAPDSPAVDQIPLAACHVTVPIRNASDTPTAQSTITTDQRGMKRPQGKACDIGAYEFMGSSP